MYVVSSRPERTQSNGKWVVLYSGNGIPPPQNSPVQPEYLPAGLVNSLVDPVLLVVHGFNAREQDAFDLTAQAAGLMGRTPSLAQFGFAGTVIGFDWPTDYVNTLNPQALLGTYQHDLTQAKANAVPAFSSFLSKLTGNLTGRGLHVVLLAHSMGNFVVTRSLVQNPALAQYLSHVVSFAPDILQTDPELPDMQTVAAQIQVNWFVYWAQCDMVLMTASNWANILLGTEVFGQERLGQTGLRPGVQYSGKIFPQKCDQLIADVGQTSFDLSLGIWRYSISAHGAYLKSPDFWQNISQNVTRPAPANPIPLLRIG